MQTTPGFEISFWIGALLPVTLVTVGGLWCFSMMRRPNVNRMGVASLGILLIAWALAMIGSMPRIPALKIVAGVIGVIGLVTSTVLAISALVHHAPDKHRQGKGQAIASLILAGLTGMAVLFFAVTTIAMKGREAREARTAAQRQPIELPDHQFRLKSLPSPWVRIPNPEKLNGLACLGLSRTRPEMYFMVIAERVASQNEDSLELFVGAVKSNLLQGDPTAQFVEERPETINGRAGVRIVATARISNLDLVYRYWVHCSPGRLYQVISWSPAKDRASMLAQSEPVFSNIEILTPKE
jgi:hypothetical protein